MTSKRLWLCSILTAVLLTLAGCSGGGYTRHLTSDASLLTPGKTTKKDVLSVLGQPAEKQVLNEQGEVWIYYQIKKSTLRKTPYLGSKMGYEEYDVLNVTFSGDLVNHSVYRALTEEEFRKGDSKE